jgi:fructosamine-3-kinase
VVFDPATYAGSLPAGMEIVDIEGTAYLQVVVNGWNSSLPLDPLVVGDRYTAFTCEAKCYRYFRLHIRSG